MFRDHIYRTVAGEQIEKHIIHIPKTCITKVYGAILDKMIIVLTILTDFLSNVTMLGVL